MAEFPDGDAFAEELPFPSVSALTTSTRASNRFCMLSSRALLLSTHWVVESGIHEPFLIVRRTANPYTSAAEVRSSFEAVRKVVDLFERFSTSVLVDMRLAPPRDDAEFERAAGDQPRFLSQGFKRSAVLIRTAIGHLHVQRHMQSLGLPMKVFNDEQAAFAYIRGRMEPASTSTPLPASRRSS